MDENYNLTLLVISNEAIVLTDFLKRVEKFTDKKITVPLPEIKISGIPSFALERANFGLVLSNIISNRDLELYNAVYSETRRGIFQIQETGIAGPDVAKELFEELVNFTNEIGYKDVFAYEIGINFVTTHVNYPEFNLENKFKTLSNPRYRGIKLQSANVGKRDLREEYTSEISVEMLIREPWKSQVSTVHRMKDFNSSIIGDIFHDIDSLLSLIR